MLTGIAWPSSPGCFCVCCVSSRKADRFDGCLLRGAGRASTRPGPEGAFVCQTFVEAVPVNQSLVLDCRV